jgi:hypothetical protein
MHMCRSLLLACLAATAPAAADQLVYSNNFESGAGSEWSNQTTTNAAPFSRFLGRYSNAFGVNLQLTIPGPPNPIVTGGGEEEPGGGGGGGGGNNTGGGAGGTGMPYLLLFDFYCLDSWDGYANDGPDRFMVFINTVSHLNTTFANQHQYQDYPQQPTLGPEFLGFTGGFRDSIYRDMAIPFDPGTATSLTVRFYGEVMQGMNDESWGIDNVRIYYAPVPTPGSLALAAVGGAVLIRRKRR